MKCPNCGYQFPKYEIECIKCNHVLEPDEYLNTIIWDFNKKYESIVHTIPESSKIYFKNINLDEISGEYYKKYTNDEISPESLAINYYKENGYNAFFAENHYWFLLFLLFYCKDEILNPKSFHNSLYGYYPNPDYHIDNIHDMDFEEIRDFDLINYIITTYFNILDYRHFEDINYIFNEGNTGRTKFNYFKIDELLSAVCYLNVEQFILIFKRMGSDLDYYSKGLPDLIVYNDNEFFLVEVKSKTDNFSTKQIQWHKFLSETVKIDVVIFSIDKSQNQIEYIKKQYEETSELMRKQEFSIKSITHVNEILMVPDVDYFGTPEKKYTVLKYTINHTSGKGESRQFFELFGEFYNEKTDRWNYENKDDKFINSMWAELPFEEKIRECGIEGKYSLISIIDLEGIKQTNEYLDKLEEVRNDLIYEKAKKLYYPNVFVDYRPTKKHLERNKNAKLLEEKGDYVGAAELYEKNVSEKTGSPTTYKRLVNIYSQSGDFYRIKEIMDIAIPIFIYLDDKKNTMFFIKTKKNVLRDNRYLQYYKFVTPEENDYLYDNCCVENADSLVYEKIKELKSKYKYEGYSSSR